MENSIASGNPQLLVAPRSLLSLCNPLFAPESRRESRLPAPEPTRAVKHKPAHAVNAEAPSPATTSPTQGAKSFDARPASLTAASESRKRHSKVAPSHQSPNEPHPSPQAALSRSPSRSSSRMSRSESHRVLITARNCRNPQPPPITREAYSDNRRGRISKDHSDDAGERCVRVRASEAQIFIKSRWSRRNEVQCQR